MKKFKVIEASRFSKGEMAGIKGGEFFCQGIHNIMCGTVLVYATCESFVPNYMSTQCHGGRTYETCGDPWSTYNIETCLSHTVCGGSMGTYSIGVIGPQ